MVTGQTVEPAGQAPACGRVLARAALHAVIGGAPALLALRRAALAGAIGKEKPRQLALRHASLINKHQVKGRVAGSASVSRP